MIDQEMLHKLENLTTPVGLLDEATRKALIEHGGPYVVWENNWMSSPFTPEELRSHGRSLVYRVKRQPLIKPTADWSYFHEDVKCLAFDDSEDLIASDVGLVKSGRFWASPRGSVKFWNITGLLPDGIVTRGTVPWDQSLISRPE